MAGTRRPVDSVLKKVIEGRMEGKKTPGRPRETLLDWLKKDNKVDYMQPIRKAENRTD